uniref:Uncharacterized protein n=1 Tax=Manihot esculenta TaxID=3983 RepID=A0A2C9U1R9_MANES
MSSFSVLDLMWQQLIYFYFLGITIQCRKTPVKSQLVHHFLIVSDKGYHNQHPKRIILKRKNMGCVSTWNAED